NGAPLEEGLALGAPWQPGTMVPTPQWGPSRRGARTACQGSTASVGGSRRNGAPLEEGLARRRRRASPVVSRRRRNGAPLEEGLAPGAPWQPGTMVPTPQWGPSRRGARTACQGSTASVGGSRRNGAPLEEGLARRRRRASPVVSRRRRNGAPLEEGL